MNIVILHGNLGAAPELRFTAKGTPVLNFTLATNERWWDAEANTERERTTWHRCVLWGKRGEGLAKVLRRGMLLAVRGRLHTSEYEKNNEKRYLTEVVIDELDLPNRPKAAPSEQPPVEDDGEGSWVGGDGR